MSKIIKREEIFQGKILHVVKDQIELPNGKTAEREIVLHQGASAVIAVDRDEKILFVEQYRHPIGAKTLEIPAGLLEPEEDPMECARRELEEETGYIPGMIEPVYAAYSSIGFSNEKLYLYYAADLQEGKQNLDEDEFVEVHRFTLEEAVKLIFDHKIIDSKTISAIFALWYRRNQTKK